MTDPIQPVSETTPSKSEREMAMDAAAQALLPGVGTPIERIAAALLAARAEEREAMLEIKAHDSGMVAGLLEAEKIVSKWKHSTNKDVRVIVAAAIEAMRISRHTIEDK